MKSPIRALLIALGALLLIAGGAYYWFFVGSQVPGDAQYALDIGEVRRLAGTVSGNRPAAIEVERVGQFRPPATFVVAGDGWSPTELPVFSYRLVFPERSIVIDTALNGELGGASLTAFDAEAFARIQEAMLQSSLVLLTHEHEDHIGGLATHPNLAAVLPKTRLTREQAADVSGMGPAKLPDHALDGYVPLDYAKYFAIAAGVVLIKSPGHTPGSQMIYVRTNDGTEFLFIGDVAWHFRNIELQRERPRFITQFTINEDRTAVFGQLRALLTLHEAEPQIKIVPGHDGTLVDQLVGAGLMRSHFSLGTQAANVRP